MVDREEVIRLASQLPNYTEVAKQLGISRERVRQICKDVPLTPPLKGYLPIREAAEHFGYSTLGSNFADMVKAGVLPRFKFKNQWYVKVDGFTIAPCLICGKPIAPDRFHYCSEECLQEATRQSHKRINWRRFKAKQGMNTDTPALAYRPRSSQRIVRIGNRKSSFAGTKNFGKGKSEE